VELAGLEDIQLADPGLIAQLRTLDQQHMLAAREDPNAFVTYVLRDEETGLPIVQSRWHMEWQALLTRHRRLILWSHTESGKTAQLGGRLLWELGRNPQLRIVILSNTNEQARRVTTQIGRYIEFSGELHRVFPGLVPDEALPWTVQQKFVARPHQAKDPSIRSLGVHSNILGGRIDLLIIDDILDYENTRTPGQRDDLVRWLLSTIEGRLTRKARVWWIGNAWHVDDAMHRFAAHPAWRAFRYAVVDDRGQTIWPDRWPQGRVDTKRAELGPVEFARQMMCKARSDEESRFKEAWIEQCKKRGEGKTLIHALREVPQGHRTYTGVDLGVRVAKTRGAGKPDLTCLFTIAVHPDGTRQVLDIDSGNWAGSEIVEKIISAHARYHSIVLVENNAAQEFILQFTRAKSAVPVRPFHTGKNKYHPEFGVEGVATEMANGKWIIPCMGGMHPEVAAWVNELLYYDPKVHAGDRLMASWFAREGARMATSKGRVRTGRIDLMSR